MIVAALLTILAVASDSALLCVIDAATRAPLIGAQVTLDDSTEATSGDARTTRRASVRVMSSACIRLPSRAIVVRRVGYRPFAVAPRAGPGARTVALVPLVGSTTRLDSVRVVASMPGPDDAMVARLTGSLTVVAARRAGVTTTAQLIERLPFVQLRSARGATAFSVRGARSEQVLITMDGLSLNDPATGLADVSDVPLSAVSAATIVLGADPVGSGPGALGGVLALTSAAQRVLAVRAGSLGQISAEGAWSRPIGRSLWNAAVSRSVASNDFVFANAAGATGTSIRERRLNNDESRLAMSVGMIATNWQLAGFASRSDRGMVGPANVRTYDADRAHTDRILLRARSAVHGVQLAAGLRTFGLAYRDPARPLLDANARAVAGDVDIEGDLAWRPFHGAAIGWRAGAGGDGVRATGGITQTRGRAFASTQIERRTDRLRTEMGARFDLVAPRAITPSFSLAAEHRVRATWTLGLRAAQAMRVPTLYDLYFASPQRLFVRPLRPERVLADIELLSRSSRDTPFGRAQLEITLVTRRTRDAIIWFPGNFSWSPANVGEERLRGTEGRVQFAPTWGTLSAWATFYNANLTLGALRIPSPYVSRVAAGSEWIVRHRWITASLHTRTMGRRPFTSGPRNPAYELPAITLLDVGLTHTLPRAITLSHTESLIAWTVDNVGDVAWQSVRGFPSPGRTWAITLTIRHAPQP